VVGITKFCVHPEAWFRSKVRVGGTKDIHPEIIRDLHPDLIIANKEENVKEQVEGLMDLAQVYVSDISDLNGALGMIAEVGRLTGREPQAGALIATIEKGFSAPATGEPIPCAYFIWKNPWMVAGGDTFINDMLHRAGFVNVFGNKTRYPSVHLDALVGTGCEAVLLSSEPYPFREKHMAEVREVLPEARILLVDGEMFSWYGSRLQYAPGYFRELRAGFRP
jgi:ABC-type Fe3+-hydroxamate transport system substrate-binding protein